MDTRRRGQGTRLSDRGQWNVIFRKRCDDRFPPVMAALRLAG